MRDLFESGHAYPSLANERLVDVLRLIRSENVGPVTFFKLFSHFGSVQAALAAIPEMSVRGGRKKPIQIAAKRDAEEEIEKAEHHGAKLIMYGSAAYPQMLHTIHDPPPVIMALGNPHLWQRGLNVGIVGARNASANGCRFTAKLSADLGEEDVTVVSGLARGIDAAAHQGAMATGTVGVIAGGIDTVYPPENAALYDRMRTEGAILTEQPFGTAPQPRNFPARNRIISGMSHGVVVVEASLNSGSLITAHVAAAQGRDVFAVPGSPMDPRCKGTNQLLREGAIVTEDAQHVLQHLQQYRGKALHEPLTPDFSPSSGTPTEKELEEARKLIVQKLGHDPVLVDELLAQCQLTTGAVITVLLELELAGRLSRHPGNRVSLLYSG